MAKDIQTQVAELMALDGAEDKVIDFLKNTGRWKVTKSSNTVSVGFYMAGDFTTYAGVVRVAKVFNIKNTQGNQDDSRAG